MAVRRLMFCLIGCVIVFMTYMFVFKESYFKKLSDDKPSSVTDALKEIQRKIWMQIKTLQETGNCEDKLFIHCTNKNFAGFGSMVHRYGACIQVAFGLGRTFFIYQPEYDRFGGLSQWLLEESKSCNHMREKSKYFKSRCNLHDKRCYMKNGYEVNNTYKVLEYIPSEQFPAPRHIPGTIPHEIELELTKLNIKDPKMWFASQFLGYLLLRPNKKFKKRYVNKMKRLNLKYPFISFHIRHGDKLIKEAKYIKEEKFVEKAVNYYERNYPHSKNKRIYVASDDFNIQLTIEKLLPKNSSYKVFMQTMRYRNKSIRPYLNYTIFPKQVIESVLIDLYFMVYSNYTVCTYTSNIGRLVNLLKRAIPPFVVNHSVEAVDDENLLAYKWWGYWYASKMSKFFVSVKKNDKKRLGTLPLLTYTTGTLFKTMSKKGLLKKTKGARKKAIVEYLSRKRRTRNFIAVQKFNMGKNNTDIGFVNKNDLYEWPGRPKYHFYK